MEWLGRSAGTTPLREPVGQFANEDSCDRVTLIEGVHRDGFYLRQRYLHRVALTLQAFRSRSEPTSAAGLVDDVIAFRNPMGCARRTCIDERRSRAPERSYRGFPGAQACQPVVPSGRSMRPSVSSWLSQPLPSFSISPRRMTSSAGTTPSGTEHPWSSTARGARFGRGQRSCRPQGTDITGRCS